MQTTNHYGLKVLIIFAIVLFSLPNFCSGSAPSGPFLTMYLPQGHVYDALSGKGYNPSTLATPMTINSVNPAALVDLKRGFGLSYQYETKMQPAWIADIGHQRIFNAVPQSAGLSIPLGKLHLGMAMNQVYNSELDYGEIIGTIILGNNRGYTENYTFHPKKIESVYRYSFTAAYSLNRLKSVTIGFRYNHNHLYFSQYFRIVSDNSKSIDSLITGIPNIDEKVNSGNISAGIRWEANNQTFQRILVGLFFDSETNFKHRFNHESEAITISGSIPAKVHIGLYLEIPCGFYFSENLTYVFWKNTYSRSGNQPEIAVNLGFPMGKKLTISGGAFYTNYNTGLTNDELRALYLIAGGIYNIKNYSIELTVADSHLFSGEYRKQTLVKAGIGYSF